MAESEKSLGVTTSVPEPLTKTDNATGIIVIISVIAFFLLVIGIWMYRKYMRKGKNYDSSVFFRFEQFSKISVSKFTLTLVIAYLVAGVVNGFNRSMMIPIVQSLFPNEDMWGSGVSLPRGAVMYPGLFFLLVISFFLSLFVVFVLAELTYQVVMFLTNRGDGVAKKVGIFILVFLLLGLMIWNIIDLQSPEAPHITTLPSNIITSGLTKKKSNNEVPIKEYKKLLSMTTL